MRKKFTREELEQVLKFADVNLVDVAEAMEKAVRDKDILHTATLGEIDSLKIQLQAAEEQAKQALTEKKSLTALLGKVQ